jgi:stage III sporulation protein AE
MLTPHTVKWMPHVIFLIALMLLLASTAYAQSPTETVIKEQAKHLNTDQVETYWNDLLKQYGGFFPDRKPPTLMEMIVPGGEGLSLKSVFTGLLRFFFHEIFYNGKLLASIIILTVFSMILETLQSAFARNAVSKVAYSISYIVLIIIAINSFSVAIGYAK